MDEGLRLISRDTRRVRVSSTGGPSVGLAWSTRPAILIQVAVDKLRPRDAKQKILRIEHLLQDPTESCLGLNSIVICIQPYATKSHLKKVTQKNFENLIKSDKVVIFSKSNCCYSQAAKILFNDINMKYTAIELDRREDGAFLQTHLGIVTGSMIVPRIFILGKFIGGYGELVKLHKNGSLLRLLKRD